jgi:hypothetical protein
LEFVIKKGKHRAFPPPIGLWCNKTTLRRVISFDDNCKYDLGNDDQFDTNKLFGIGYLEGFHKEDSARFGWRYDTESGKIILTAFCHVNGVMVYEDLCSVFFFRKYLTMLLIDGCFYRFLVVDAESPFTKYGDVTIRFTHDKMWSYPLGPYFGGNQTAPHDMSLHISKV